MAEATLVANDQVVAGEIEVLEGERIQREKGLVVSFNKGQPVQE